MNRILRLLPCTSTHAIHEEGTKQDPYTPLLAEIPDEEVSYPYFRTVPVFIHPNTGAFHPELPPFSELTPSTRLNQIIDRAVDIVMHDAASYTCISPDSPESSPIPCVKLYLTGMDQSGKRTIIKQLEHNWRVSLNLAKTQCTNILRLVSNALAFLCERSHLYGTISRSNQQLYSYLMSLNNVYSVQAYHDAGCEQYTFSHNLRVDDGQGSFFNPKPNRGTDALLGPIEAYLNLWKDPVIQKTWANRSRFTPDLLLFSMDDSTQSLIASHIDTKPTRAREMGDEDYAALTTPMGVVPLQIPPDALGGYSVDAAKLDHTHREITFPLVYRSMRTIHRHFLATFPQHAIKSISKHTTTPYPENVELIMSRLQVFLQAEKPKPQPNVDGEPSHVDPSLFDKVIPYEYIDALLDSNPRPYDDCALLTVSPALMKGDEQRASLPLPSKEATIILAPGAVNRRHRGTNEFDHICDLIYCVSLIEHTQFVTDSGNDLEYTTDRTCQQVENKLVHSINYFRQLLALPSLQNSRVHLMFTREHNLSERLHYLPLAKLFPHVPIACDEPHADAPEEEWCEYTKRFYTHLFTTVFEESQAPVVPATSSDGASPVQETGENDLVQHDEAQKQDPQEGDGQSNHNSNVNTHTQENTSDAVSHPPLQLQSQQRPFTIHLVNALDAQSVLSVFSTIINSAASLADMNLPTSLPATKKTKAKCTKRKEEPTGPLSPFFSSQTRHALTLQVRDTLMRRFPLLKVEREREEEQVRLKGHRYENLIRFHCRYRAYWYNIHLPHFTHLFDKAFSLRMPTDVMPPTPVEAAGGATGKDSSEDVKGVTASDAVTPPAGSVAALSSPSTSPSEGSKTESTCEKEKPGSLSSSDNVLDPATSTQATTVPAVPGTQEQHAPDTTHIASPQHEDTVASPQATVDDQMHNADDTIQRQNSDHNEEDRKGDGPHHEGSADDDADVPVGVSPDSQEVCTHTNPPTASSATINDVGDEQPSSSPAFTDDAAPGRDDDGDGDDESESESDPSSAPAPPPKSPTNKTIRGDVDIELTSL